MKKVQWLQGMIEKAKSEGTAIKKKSGYEVFSIEVSEEGQLTVYREGTLILDANVHTKEVQNNSGGYSRTDAQYINHIMSEFGMLHDLRYAHTRKHYENGMTLVNLYPKMALSLSDQHLADIHKHVAGMVGQIYGQKVVSSYVFEQHEFHITRESDGRLIYSMTYEEMLAFTNEKGKKDSYKNYFTGEDLARIAIKKYADTVGELIKNEYFDIHHKQVVQ